MRQGRHTVEQYRHLMLSLSGTIALARRAPLLRRFTKRTHFALELHSSGGLTA
jgi:hypothetical protein